MGSLRLHDLLQALPEHTERLPPSRTWPRDDIPSFPTLTQKSLAHCNTPFGFLMVGLSVAGGSDS